MPLSLTEPHENKGTYEHDDRLEGVCVNNWGQAPCEEKERSQDSLLMRPHLSAVTCVFSPTQTLEITQQNHIKRSGVDHKPLSASLKP